MKTMKTWEIHADIQKFRMKKTKFKLIYSPRTIRTTTNKVVPNGSVVKIGSFGSDGNTFYDLSFNGVLIESNNAFAEWAEIKEPVTWQEAIQAWIDGKNIYCILGDETYKYTGHDILGDDYCFGIGKDELVLGKWYIED